MSYRASRILTGDVSTGDGPNSARMDGDSAFGGANKVLFLDSEVAEVLLLLPASQAAALEAIARRRGLTVGHLIRALIQKSLAIEGQ